MPSEPMWQHALAAVARERAAYTAAVARANDQLRLLLGTMTPHDRTDNRSAEQLGAFAAGHIDSSRFTDVFTPTSAIPADAIPTVRYAQYLLKATLTLGDEAFCFTLPSGEDLRDATRRALAVLGRVFAAGHAVAAIRAKQVIPVQPEPLLSPLPPEQWSKAERGIAPPVAIELDGADLRVGGLETLLQGAQKIVLLVKGAAPPAALVRLITPNVFVMQCADATELGEFTHFEGAGIAAVIPDAIHFVHDPDARTYPRLRVIARPERAIKRLGNITAFQQMEEVRWLDQLAGMYEQQATHNGNTSNTQPHEPGDQLAAWLLKQATLS